MLPSIGLPLECEYCYTPIEHQTSEQSRVLHVIDQLRDEGEGIPVMNSVGVEISIVLARSQGSILFGHKEKRRGLWGF